MANYYVSTAAELQSALTEAQSNGLDDVIHIAQGMYTGGFTYISTESNDLSILGGYSIDFSSRDIDATNTILDGSHLVRNLNIQATNGSFDGYGWVAGSLEVAANILIDAITIKNGEVANSGAGVNIRTDGDVTIINSILTENHTSASGNVMTSWGGGINIDDAKNVDVVNNIITDNSGTYGGAIACNGIDGDFIINGNVIAGNENYGGVGQKGAGIYLDISHQTGHAIITNNTITGNYSETQSVGAGVYVRVALEATIENNVIWGNTGGVDQYIGIINNDLFVSYTDNVNINNNYLGDYYVEMVSFNDGVTTNISNNIESATDPLFVDADNGDYRLSSDSPLIDQGVATANVASTDLDGNIRIVGSAIDIGAYEYQSTVVPTTPVQAVDAWNPLTNEVATYNENSFPEGWLTEIPIAWDDFLTLYIPTAFAWTELNGVPYNSPFEYALYSDGLMLSLDIDTQASSVFNWSIQDKAFIITTANGFQTKTYLLELADDYGKAMVVYPDATYALIKAEPLDRPEYFIDSDNDSYANVIDAYPNDSSNHLNITKNDNIQGTLAIDNITTLGGSNVISTLAGNDTITLTADAVWGAGYSARNVSNDSSTGTGEKIALEGLNRFSDVIDGGADTDALILTDGNDAFFIDDVYSDHHSSLTLTSTTQGIDSTARITNLEVINAGDGNDIVDLTSTNYILANAVVINGEAGNDNLWGSNGNDTIDGGTGDDTIFGGTGSDTLTGGTGADAFQFTTTSMMDGSGVSLMLDFYANLDTPLSNNQTIDYANETITEVATDDNGVTWTQVFEFEIQSNTGSAIETDTITNTDGFSSKIIATAKDYNGSMADLLNQNTVFDGGNFTGVVSGDFGDFNFVVSSDKDIFGNDVITDFDVSEDKIQLYYRAEDNHTNADLSLASGVLTWDVDTTNNDVVIDLSASINSSDLVDLDALITFVEIV